ncbi:unnamed protein product [Rotaria sp. Silwood2]|nr:unnamed protein product [Rotaria sp. Silwood2]CAF3984429.1 unnamed protein product [Rotaria sp. Silwood2]
MSSWFNNLPCLQYSSFQRISISESWFQVYAIHPIVFAIHETYQHLEIISYLIVDPKKSLLIDTEMDIGNIEKVFNDLTAVSLTGIKTRTQHDHVGDNWHFEQSLIDFECELSRNNDHALFTEAHKKI